MHHRLTIGRFTTFNDRIRLVMFRPLAPAGGLFCVLAISVASLSEPGLPRGRAGVPPHVDLLAIAGVQHSEHRGRET